MVTAETLAGQPFLAGMTDYQLGLLASLAGGSMFHAGNRIFREGEPADRFWLIIEGSVRLESDLAGQGAVELETLRPGSVLGWSWLFPPYRWHLGAVAVTTTRTLAFDGPRVRELGERHPAFGYDLTTRFLCVMGERLQATRRRLEECRRAAGQSDAA